MTKSPVTPSELESLARLLPAFEFGCLIAHGNSSSVYKARHRSLDRDVAIKLVRKESSVDPAYQTSAKAMAKLSHPNLIRVYDSGETGGFFYTVMEFVPGKSLEHSARGKVIDVKQASEIIIAACEGLAYAHANGVTHGGITPSDILLNQKCEPKIGNFGTTLCMRSDITLRTDVLALGLILRELLTGVSRDSRAAASATVPDLKLAIICRKATHQDPERRYPDASAFREAIQRAIQPTDHRTTIRNKQASPLRHPKPVLVVRRNNHSNAAFAKFAVIILLLVGIYGAWGFREAKLERLVRLQLEEDTKRTHFIVESAQPDHSASTALVRWEQ